MKDFVIIDGSNIATECRTLPSLVQLKEAVVAFGEEYPKAKLIVVVDGTFEHRLELEEERIRFKEAESRGEYVVPPAGTIGRGDAFILKMAVKVNAVILSNDSFQEFHGENPWLFDSGRLIGGKPVLGIGWIFAERSPVRGPKSRASTAKQISKNQLGQIKEKRVARKRPRGVASSVKKTPKPSPSRRSRARTKKRRASSHSSQKPQT